MKKIILSVTVAAFALVPALQADDAKACNKDKAACADKAKAGCAEKAACCAGKTSAARKVAKTDVKGATLLVQR